MKTNQEVIQEAWGNFYEKAKHAINSDGWFERNKDRDLTLLTHFSVDEMRFSGLLIRPKVLDGIETNNHWISIDGNIKVDNGKYWVRLFNPDTNIESFEVINVLHGVIDYYFATHYQPIIKPQAPIY